MNLQNLLLTNRYILPDKIVRHQIRKHERLDRMSLCLGIGLILFLIVLIAH